MTKKRLLSLALAFLMVFTLLPNAIAESQNDTTVVYGYSVGGVEFYACDQNGLPDFSTTINPNTITHLYLAPKEDSDLINPLRIPDRTVLRWLTVVDPQNILLHFPRDAFTGYPNLEKVHFPESISSTSLEIFEKTSVRSFTLPQGDLNDCLFQKCPTIEEIINPTENDVALTVHYKDIIVPAGGRWQADFGVPDQAFYSTLNADFELQLQAYGADHTQPIVWSFSDGRNIPEGFELSADGVLTGKFPSERSSDHIYITATQGELTASGYVSLAAYDAIDVNINLPEGVTLKEGPVGKGIMNPYAPVVFTFETNDSLPDGYHLRTVKLTEIEADGYKYDISNDYYSFYNNQLHIDAEALSTGSTLVVEPIISRMDSDVAKAAPLITLPYKETLGDEPYIYFNSKEYNYQGKGVAVDANMGDVLNISLSNPEDPEQDTFLLIGRMNKNGTMDCIATLDEDAIGYGEQVSYFCSENESYYIFALCYLDSSLNNCLFTITMEKNTINFPENPKYTECFYFDDSEYLPMWEEDDLWLWDDDTKTLTLKDGFTIFAKNDFAFYLSDNTTIIVEGKATIISSYESIYCSSDLTIILNEKADLSIVSFEDEAIDVEDGRLKVVGKNKSAKLSLYAFDDGVEIGSSYEQYDPDTGNYIGFPVPGNIEMSDVTLSIYSSSDALQVNDGDITLSNCDVTIRSQSDGILVDSYSNDCKGTITLTNCKIKITSNDQSIQNYAGDIIITDCEMTFSGETALESKEAITISGGSLVANAVNESPVFGIYNQDNGLADITLNNVNLNLQADYSMIFEGYIGNVTITNPNDLVLSDESQVLYTGQWDQQIYMNFVNEGQSVSALQTLIYGDANGDLKVTAADALEVLKTVVGKTQLSGRNFVCGDVDGDEELSATDALEVLKKVVGKINHFFVEGE